jgi:CRISPR/Cas system endoribonuclease Cas6 (RAMP superfamily)
MKCSMCNDDVVYYKQGLCLKHYKKHRRSLLTDDQRQYENLRDNLKSKYNMTIEEYMHRLDKQKGLCAACGQEETKVDTKTGRTQRLSVDHSHVTGGNRDLLCYACNTSLGHLKDDAERIWKLLVYKRKWS